MGKIVGERMELEGEGDGCMGDGVVELGEKELVIEWEGKWGKMVRGESGAGCG